MSKKVSSFIFISFVFSAFVFVACKKKTDDNNLTSFDRSSLLVNVADNVILPAITDFESKINALETDYIAFQGDRTSINMEVVKSSWKAAYLSWQSVKIFDFGPIRSVGFKGATGTFPTDTVKIQNNINSGSYNLATAANVDAIGLPAMDFLFYRDGALNYFIGNDAYTTYGLDVIQKIKNELSSIVSSWTPYRATFIIGTGDETTSSFSLFVNEFIRDYELAKNTKLGIPIGQQSLSIQQPQYIEARFSGISLEILLKNIESLEVVYNGSVGVGFDDYLSSLDKGTLSTNIHIRFGDIKTKLNSMSGPLEEQMSTNTVDLDELYVLIQGQVINLKTDMASAFGTLITYQDNDGD